MRFLSKKPVSASQAAALAFKRFAPELRRYVLRRLRQPEDAPDLTQEIFERFVRVDHAEAIENPRAYLFRIASHVVSESLGRHERNWLVYDSELAQNVGEAFDPAAPDNLTDRLDLERDMRDALRALPENHLAVLMLVKGEGLTYEEAARQTGFSEQTIGTYVKHGRAKLKLLLEDYWNRKESRK